MGSVISTALWSVRDVCVVLVYSYVVVHYIVYGLQLVSRSCAVEVIVRLSNFTCMM